MLRNRKEESARWRKLRSVMSTQALHRDHPGLIFEPLLMALRTASVLAPVLPHKAVCPSLVPAVLVAAGARPYIGRDWASRTVVSCGALHTTRVCRLDGRIGCAWTWCGIHVTGGPGGRIDLCALDGGNGGHRDDGLRLSAVRYHGTGVGIVNCRFLDRAGYPVTRPPQHGEALLQGNNFYFYIIDAESRRKSAR